MSQTDPCDSPLRFSFRSRLLKVSRIELLKHCKVITYVMNIFSFHLSDPEDVQALIPKIKNLAGNYFDPDLDHLDYIWGTTAADTVYNVIIRMINKDEKL